MGVGREGGGDRQAALHWTTIHNLGSEVEQSQQTFHHYDVMGAKSEH